MKQQQSEKKKKKHDADAEHSATKKKKRVMEVGSVFRRCNYVEWSLACNYSVCVRSNVAGKWSSAWI